MPARPFEEELAARLQHLWKEGIPLAGHMHVRLQRVDETGLRLHAPLGPCRNHMGTGFAGALQAAMTLAGWGLTAALLDAEAPGDLVAQSVSVTFLRPVRGDFDVIAAMPSPRTVESFLRRYRRRGRARLQLEVRTDVGGICHARGEVRYAAIRHADDVDAQDNDPPADSTALHRPGAG